MGANDFERAVLGAVLINTEVWPVVSSLDPDDFSLDSHRTIYVRMIDLAQSSRPIELTTLVDQLDRHNELERIGGAGYVASLIEGLPDKPLTSVRYYVGRVRERSGLRKIAHSTERICQRAANDPTASVTSMRRQLLDIAREASQFEVERSPGITCIEDIPDPFEFSLNEVRWLVDGLIPSQGLTIIAGEAGAGKTWLALMLARALMFGNDFLGRQTLSARVIYLDRENPLSLVRSRLQVLFGGPSAFRPWGLWCQDEPPMIGDPRLLNFAQQEPVLIVDSMIRFHTADENSATQMAPVMASLRELATAGASIVVLHHKSKGDTSAYRGSSDIVAGADAAFALARRDGQLELRTIKNRFAAETTVKIQANFAAGTFTTVDSATAPERISEVDHLLNVIRSSPGLTQNEVIKQGRIQRSRVIELLRRYDSIHWCRQKGANRSMLYFPIEVVPKGIPLGSTRNHREGRSQGSSCVDSDWQEPLGITQAVPVLPPFRGGNREELGYHGA